MSEDVKTTKNDGDVNTAQENEVNFDEMTAEEVSAFVEKQKSEVIKLNSIIERKGKIVADLNSKVNDVEVPENVTKQPTSTEERLDRTDLKVDYGYPEEVIDHIMSLGGKSVLKNPLTKKVADQMAQDIKSQQATDIPDGPQGSVDRKIKVSDLENMTSAEMEKVLPHKEV